MGGMTGGGALIDDCREWIDEVMDKAEAGGDVTDGLRE